MISPVEYTRGLLRYYARLVQFSGTALWLWTPSILTSDLRIQYDFRIKKWPYCLLFVIGCLVLYHYSWRDLPSLSHVLLLAIAAFYLLPNIERAYAIYEPVLKAAWPCVEKIRQCRTKEEFALLNACLFGGLLKEPIPNRVRKYFESQQLAHAATIYPNALAEEGERVRDIHHEWKKYSILYFINTLSRNVHLRLLQTWLSSYYWPVSILRYKKEIHPNGIEYLYSVVLCTFITARVYDSWPSIIDLIIIAFVAIVIGPRLVRWILPKCVSMALGALLLLLVPFCRTREDFARLNALLYRKVMNTAPPRYLVHYFGFYGLATIASESSDMDEDPGGYPDHFLPRRYMKDDEFYFPDGRLKRRHSLSSDGQVTVQYFSGAGQATTVLKYRADGSQVLRSGL